MIIKSSESLFSDYDSISSLSKSNNEPIFITKDGNGDMVLMPLQLFEGLIKNKAFENEIRSSKPINKEINKGEKFMTENQLGLELRKMYDNAARGSQVSYIHLFGIRFAKEILENRLDKKQILKIAGLPESYQTEISKGVNLAAYVTIKPEIVFD